MSGSLENYSIHICLKSELSELQQFYSTELLTNEWFIRELSNNDMDFEYYML